jgi:hypothetical protein
MALGEWLVMRGYGRGERVMERGADWFDLIVSFDASVCNE